MASLQEVKMRIASVNSTRKITNAMKMVASSKLHRAQQAIEGMRPYQSQLSSMMERFLSSTQGEVSSPYAQSRPIQKVAIVAISSNSSLCGGFNTNVAKRLEDTIVACRQQGIRDITVYPIGNKIAESARKLGFGCSESAAYAAMLDHPQYVRIVTLAQELMDKFVQKEFDQVIVLYHQFKSTSTQLLLHDTMLPVDLSNRSATTVQSDYIIEPSAPELLASLLPLSISLRLFTAILDSLASEHAARVMAMQIATDNADDLLRELTLTYNKTRQQAITNELLDIAGGSAR